MSSSNQDGSDNSEVNKDGNVKPVAAVERALSILNAFRGEVNPLNLFEISEKTGLYKSTALRLLETLQSHGYILKLDDGRYQLGAIVFELGAVYQKSFKLENHIQPVLEKLSVETDESATFYIRHGDVRQCMWRVESPQSVRDVLLVGQTLKMGESSDSQVFNDFDQITGGIDLSELSEYIRESSRADNDPTASVSSPVFGVDGFIGVLTISGPAERFTPTVVEEIRGKLISTVTNLSHELGFSY